MKDKAIKDTTPCKKGDCGCKDCAGKANGVSRRGFARGAVVAPVLASFASLPVLGDTVACSPSGLGSTNLSGHAHDDCAGYGCTPGFWMNNLDAWACTPFSPGTCIVFNNGGQCKQWGASVSDGASPFTAAFPTGLVPVIPGIATPSLLETLLFHNQISNDPHPQYFFHLVAAILNAWCSPQAYLATPQQIQDIHDQISNGTANFTAEQAKDTLDKMNNRGCFLNAHGECQEPFDPDTGMVIENQTFTCVPVCKEGFTYNSKTGKCEPDIAPE